MHLYLSRELWHRLLTTIQGVVDKRHTMPILSNIRLILTADQLKVTGSDLEVELTASLPLPEGACRTEGQTTLPARKLLDIVKSLPVAAQIELQVQDQKAILKSGSSRFTLGTLPASDFPDLGELQEAAQVTLSQQALRQLIERTSFAMAVQDVRYYLTGTLFEAEGQTLRTVTTDGHRLAMAEAEAQMDASQLASEQILQAIVPRKAIFELQRLLDNRTDMLSLRFGREMLGVNIELPLDGERVLQLQFASRLIDGKFPDYRRVIPRQGNKIMQVSRADWMQTLQRVAILSNEKLRGVLLHFTPQQMTLKANNVEQDEATEDMAAQYQGEELEMLFNVQYLLDALGVMAGEDAQLVMSESNASALLVDPHNDSYRYVVMPMRV